MTRDEKRLRGVSLERGGRAATRLPGDDPVAHETRSAEWDGAEQSAEQVGHGGLECARWPSIPHTLQAR